MTTESDTLVQLIRLKIEEQIELTEHLVSLVPADKLEWAPRSNSFRICDLLGHLLECLAGFCATFVALYPETLAHFDALREVPTNHCCGIQEATSRILEFRTHIGAGFAEMADADLSRRIPTVFVPEGEAVLTLLLANFEHLVNHKHQLFSYLKLLGVEVASSDLYLFR